ncbi:flagellar assembly protein A [Paludibacterium yongneupense]|uniref:flagellar assembly protein A n=1 Tax=Paludibacterium yongneupense TaxID=400061 RepID=UPI0003FC62DC|nr:flagellar assembly protein A [Paludibacterium yongneupense]
MPNDTTADLKQFGDSSFIIKTPDGVYVDLARLDSTSQFVLFADRIHTSAYYFSGLDCKVFQQLLGRETPADLLARYGSGKTKITVLRFASDILTFPAERRALYRSPFLTAQGEAEYLFELVMMDKSVLTPLYQENESGVSEFVGSEKRVMPVRASLALDEFVAAMWLQGIRYGFDVDLVADYIANGRTGRIVVARPLAPGESLDACVHEETKKLYRDNAPRKLSDGRVDLKQFKNRFPQIRQGERLLKKIPRVLGEAGVDIGGRPIEAEVPQDFDLVALAGEGTRIERTPEGEFIVASMDGFLNIDTETNRIAVMEKIVNYTGVSMRTTGDIALDGEHFEEHGEVQEKRVIEGRNITVMADVFGKVLSSGGAVLLKQNLVGGSAVNMAGDIAVEGLTSNAVVEARAGSITLARAENSLIVGRRVKIDSAVNCTIVGECVDVSVSLGSLVAGKEIRIAHAQSRRERQTEVSVLLPDTTALAGRIAKLEWRIGEITVRTDELRAQMDALSQNTEVRSYMIITGRLQRKEMTVTDEQKIALQKLGQRVAPVLKSIAAIKAEFLALSQERKSLQDKASGFAAKGRAAFDGIVCSIAEFEKDTLVRKLSVDVGVLFALSPKELNARLCDTARPADRLPVLAAPFFWQAEVSAVPG